MLYTSHSHSRYHRTFFREKGSKLLHLMSFRWMTLQTSHPYSGWIFTWRCLFPSECRGGLLDDLSLVRPPARDRQKSPVAHLSDEYAFHLSSVHVRVRPMCVRLLFRVCLLQGVGWFAVLLLQTLILHLGNVFRGCSIHIVHLLQPCPTGKSCTNPVHLKNKSSIKNIYLRRYFQIVHISSVKHDLRAIWTS